MKKKLIAYINAENEIRGSVINRAEKYDHEGADQLFLYNYSKDEATRDSFLALAKKIIHSIDIPVVLGLYVSKFEDIKKALYTGAVRVVVKETILDNQFAIKEATDRFGADRIFVEVDSHGDFSNVKDIQKLKDMGVYGILLKHVVISDTLIENMKKSEMSIIIRDALIRNDLAELMSLDQVLGVATNHFEHKVIMKAKYALKDKGIDVETYESMLSFSDFKLNSDGMIPVIAQDYRTGEVLMMAYMNEEAFDKTIKTGRMTYWSRSREELW